MGYGKNVRRVNKSNTPKDTVPSKITVDEPLFFYLPDCKHGEFCQWFPSAFVVSRRRISELICRLVVEDQTDSDLDTTITFNCAEQFMMYCKAACFNDVAHQAQILSTDSPKEQKALGKLTVGFSEEEWDKVKYDVVEAGNLAKFGQNRHIRGRLLATGDRLLCEAASRDRVWGIGYTAKHAMNFQQHWGENLLGKALMSTRQKLRDECRS